MIALMVLIAIIIICGALLGYFSIHFKVEGDPLADKVNAVLPQTQCGQCGFPGCKPYAEAIAEGSADINRCVPGGMDTVEKIADLMGVEPKALDPSLDVAPAVAQKAFIMEELCVGCTKCIQVCPVDAILGSRRHLHTVIQSECTGCELCVPVCPVECIIMRDTPELPQNWIWPKPLAAWEREETADKQHG